MLIIKVDKDKCKVLIDGKPAQINAELVIAIKAFHDSVVKDTASIYQNIAHLTAVESVKMALDLISD